jgi:hypothetical protein
MILSQRRKDAKNGKRQNAGLFAVLGCLSCLAREALLLGGAFPFRRIAVDADRILNFLCGFAPLREQIGFFS